MINNHESKLSNTERKPIIFVRFCMTEITLHYDRNQFEILKWEDLRKYYHE